MKDTLRGEEGFDAYYTELFGKRWNALKASLKDEVRHEKLLFPGAKPYFLDPASVCAALSLPVKNTEQILDLCAAPGGKTLVLTGNMDSEAHLSANERSPERKARLAKVIAESLPKEKSEKITVSCSDGALWCKRQTEAFGSILLDAPCSSERHVLTDYKYLKDWSPSRIKTVSMEQWALLSSAYRLLKNGGNLLYATCALSPKENDEQIKRLLKKFSGAEAVPHKKITEVFLENLESFKGMLSEETEEIDSREKLKSLFEKSEQTQFGFHLLPDTSGTGPLYFALVKKNQSV